MINTTTAFGSLPSPTIKDQIISAGGREAIKGVRFPLYDKTSNTKGIFAQSAGIERLTGQVLQLLGTGGDERLMLPNFGLDLEEFLFEPLTEEAIYNIKLRVATSIHEYIPDAVIKRLDVLILDEGSGFGLPGFRIVLNIYSLEFETSTDITVYHRP